MLAIAAGGRTVVVVMGVAVSERLIICPYDSLPRKSLHAATFKASRDQRQCLHKWTRNVLGEDYIREAAKMYPKSKE